MSASRKIIVRLETDDVDFCGRVERKPFEKSRNKKKNAPYFSYEIELGPFATSDYAYELENGKQIVFRFTRFHFYHILSIRQHTSCNPSTSSGRLVRKSRGLTDCIHRNVM